MFDDIAARQHGLITNEQLAALRVPHTTVMRWVSDRRLFVPHEGVYRVAGAPVTFDQRCLAATLAGAPECFTSHRAAAAQWEWMEPGEVDVVVARSRLPRLAGVHVHRSRDLGRFHMTRLRGIPITPPALTLLDLGAVLPWWEVREVMEQAFVSRLVTPAALEAAYSIVARPGRRGAGVTRRLLEDRALGHDIADSSSEARFARVCNRFGLPKPVFHYKVRNERGVIIAEPDFCYPDLMIIIEIDSLSAHGTADALQKDLRRQNDLIRLGYTVLRFTWHDVKLRPEYVASMLRACLGAPQAGYGL